MLTGSRLAGLKGAGLGLGDLWVWEVVGRDVDVTGLLLECICSFVVNRYSV